MPQTTESLLVQIGVIAVAIGGLTFLLSYLSQQSLPHDMATSTQVSSAASPFAASSTLATSTEPLATSTQSKKAASAPLEKPLPESPESGTASTADDQVTRIENPYSTAPIPFSRINDDTRAALVNIVCAAASGVVRPISGSGIIIDPRGVILTNAHVAQYVLLSESAQVNLACSVGTGSPASPRWIPQVLYIPRAWIEKHAYEIGTIRSVGTGEHDYALLYIAANLDGSTPAGPFPYVSPDTREAIAFVDDQVLAASYPAEFVGATLGQNSLYPVSSVTSVKKLLTFASNSVDVISLGGIIGAQSGSSGGAVVNGWQRLVGIITTTTEGRTTSERDLRAVTLSYIDRDLAAQTGLHLREHLARDVEAQTVNFTLQEAPALIKLLIDELRR